MAKKEVSKEKVTDSKPTIQKSVPETSETQSGFSPTEFFGDTREELSKVIWPSQQQWIGESAAVISMVILVATTIYLVDNLFSWLAKAVF